jgi:NADPH:quinone reductase-like Zn-dependent oxidoreductase
MKAIVQHRYGGPETLSFEDVAEPEVGDHQVLVRVVAAGVDRGAYHVMRGLPYVVRLAGYGVRAPKVPIPGTNVAGRVEAVGARVTDLRPGDDVYGTGKGAYAEFVAADEDRVAPKPHSLTFDEAAVLPYPGTVALQAIRDRAGVEQGRSVLVVGASGAVGTIAVQVAKAFGAEVTGVCSARTADLVGGLGADHVIAYDDTGIDSGGRRYDAVIDIGGNTSVARLRRVTASRGTLVIVGGEGGGRLIGGVQRQLGAQALSPFVRQKLGTFIASEHRDILCELNELVATDHVKPVMGRSVPLADAAEAITDLDQRRTRGRLVLNP